MSTSAWFPCYPNDLLGSIRWKRMTPKQRGAYWQLICWQMQSDSGHLPSEIDTLSALSDVDMSDPQNSLILEAFPLDETGFRANERALKEWHKRKSLSGVRSEAGKTGIAKRWQKDSKCYSKPIANAATTTATTTGSATTTQTNVCNTSGKPKNQRRVLKLADESQWLAEIKTIYTPLGVDVETQLAKARAWLLSPKGKGRKLTQQFFVNWLSRADTTIKPSDSTTSDYAEQNRIAVERMNRLMDEVQ